MPFEYLIETRYSDTAQDGIVHHSSFILYLEEARLRFFQNLGFDIHEIEKEGLLLPVIDLSIQYKKPLLSMQTLSIQIEIREISKVRFTLKYLILRENIPVAEAAVSHCCINQKHRPIPLPVKIFDQLMCFK